MFGEPDADASVVELEGPPTGIALRTPQGRVSSSTDRRSRWILAAEVSGLDHSTLPDFDPDVIRTYLRLPDLTASLRAGGTRRQVQLRRRRPVASARQPSRDGRSASRRSPKGMAGGK